MRIYSWFAISIFKTEPALDPTSTSKAGLLESDLSTRKIDLECRSIFYKFQSVTITHDQMSATALVWLKFGLRCPTVDRHAARVLIMFCDGWSVVMRE